MALNATFVEKVKPTGARAGDKHTDGAGLYLLVKQMATSTSKYWRFDYRFGGKRKTLALGVYPAISLAAARKRRDDAREQLAHGSDPMLVKHEKLREASQDVATFGSVANEWLGKTAATRAPKTKQKITGWLENDILPFIGSIQMVELRPRDVLFVAERMEGRGVQDSAHRVLQLCGQICRYAIAATIVEVDVTSGLKGALAPVVSEHYPAITEPQAVGALMRAIDGYEGFYSVVAALRLAPLVFVRPGELRTAEWAEIDLDAAEWRIPAAKMKMDNDHIVPLARQAVAILRALQPLSGHSLFVFPSIRSAKQCISDGAVNAALRVLGYPQGQVTGHGFRATARTILDEVLCERVDLIEHQLAHAVKDVNGRAYNRTAHLPARREMMQRWADYLDKITLERLPNS